MRTWIAIGASITLIAVIMGALGAHALAPYLDDHGEKLFNLALSFQFWHGLAQLVLGLLHRFWPDVKTLLNLSGILFLIGIFLFSGNLYYVAVAQNTPLHMLIPFGGLAFMLGWATLIYASIKAPRT